MLNVFNAECRYAECSYTEYHIFVPILSVVMLNVYYAEWHIFIATLSVIKLDVFMLNVVAPFVT
jgi:hypothetical protein